VIVPCRRPRRSSMANDSRLRAKRAHHLDPPLSISFPRSPSTQKER
jgi:hypothetical protein